MGLKRHNQNRKKLGNAAIVGLPTFQVYGAFLIFSVMTVALILIADPLIFRHPCSQKYTILTISVSEFFVTTLFKRFLSGWPKQLSLCSPKRRTDRTD
jgi:hypothetical protein